jgi:hypothetical protein
MKLTNPYNIGACGIEQALYVGEVDFNTEGVATGIALAEVPANCVITKAVCKVKTPFNAATTNVLTLGTDEGVNDLLGTSDITEGTAGAYQKPAWIETGAQKKTIKAKYTQSGTAATAGKAEFYIFFMRLPE